MTTRLAFIATIFLISCSALFGQTSEQFSKANQAFASSDFKAAIEGYEALVRAGQDSPNLFYNLGNAYFRTKNFGHAILNYERVLVLNPRHPEAEANLRVARDEAHALELGGGKWEVLLGFATENQFGVAAAIGFWIFAFALASFLFTKRRSLIVLSILSLLISGSAVFAAYEIEHGKNGSGLAVVIADNVDARLATADNANRVLTLPAGSEIKVVSQRGVWIYAALPNDLHGWMPASSAEQVRM
jgi:tetratricopeptide (TPR) repeat protein